MEKHLGPYLKMVQERIGSESLFETFISYFYNRL